MGDEIIPYFLRELGGLSVITVDLPLVLPIGDGVAKAGFCLCNELPLHPLGYSQGPVPPLPKQTKF